MAFEFEKDVTLVLGCDSKYFEQFALTWPAYMRLWPRLKSLPWIIFFDGRDPELRQKIRNVVAPYRHYADLTLQAWLPPELGQYEDQRDRMLAAWTILPPLICQTDYWLKVDVDSFPIRPVAASFPNPRWFEGEPAIVGHKWGYTKHRGIKGDWFEILDEWGDETTLMHCDPPLGYRFGNSRRIGHPRIASFISFFNSNWTKRVASELLARRPDWTIPIPSQDTFLWYVAERMREKIVRIKMKRHGFTNQAKMRSLKARISEVMK